MAKNKNSSPEENQEVNESNIVGNEGVDSEKKNDPPAKMSNPDEKKEYVVDGIEINHSGKSYKEGSTICLTDEEAKPLKKYLKTSEVENG